MSGQTVKAARYRLARITGGRSGSRVVRTIEVPAYGMSVVRAGATGGKK